MGFPVPPDSYFDSLANASRLRFHVISRSSGSTRLRKRGHETLVDLHCFRVHYFSMRNVTLSAEEELIDRARLVAREQHTTLNEAFREWLTQFTSSNSNVEAFDDLMDRLRGVNAGRHFTRDEMNER